MINWNEIQNASIKAKIRVDMNKIITSPRYGWADGEWNLTELINTEDSRKFVAYQIFEGARNDGTVEPGAALKGADGLPFRFRFQVLSRQAVCKDKDGNKIWWFDEAKLTSGEENDIIPLDTDPPKPGDVVECKGDMITSDPDTGAPMSSKKYKAWARQGKRPHHYIEFIVDEYGCINVPYPHALSMLQKSGFRIAYPKHRKVNRQNPKRRITNWWFKEVPQDFKGKQRKTRSDKGQARISDKVEA